MITKKEIIDIIEKSYTEGYTDCWSKAADEILCRLEKLVIKKNAEEKKEQFNKMIRDYTNDLIFGKQTQVMTDMLNFTKKIWDFVNDSNFSA